MVLLVLSLILALTLDHALAAADRVNYVVYPKDGTNQDQAREITADLEALIHPTYTFVSASRYLGTFYWWAPMTATQAFAFHNTHRDTVRWYQSP